MLRGGRATRVGGTASIILWAAAMLSRPACGFISVPFLPQPLLERRARPSHVSPAMLLPHLNWRSPSSCPGSRVQLRHIVLRGGTKVVYFGKEKVLSDRDLYKFNFYQRKFDLLVKEGQPKEAIEVLITGESRIQMSPAQAVKLLSSLSGDLFAGQNSKVKPMVQGVWKLLRSHTLWHMTPTRQGKDALEKDIMMAEKGLRKRWREVESRHILLELQPFFTYSLNVSLPMEVELPEDCEDRFQRMFAKLSKGRTAIDAAMMQEALDKEWGMERLMDVETIADVMKEIVKKDVLDREDFETFGLAVINI